MSCCISVWSFLWSSCIFCSSVMIENAFCINSTLTYDLITAVGVYCINYINFINLIWEFSVTIQNYVSQQTLKPDNDYILPHQCLWWFNALGCPCRRQSISCCSSTFVELSSIAHRVITAATSLCIFCCCLKSHLFSLSYPASRLFSHLYSAHIVTRRFGHYNCYYYITLPLHSFLCLCNWNKTVVCCYFETLFLDSRWSL